MHNSYYREEPSTSTILTIDKKTGDVNGDGKNDTVSLIGTKEIDGIVISNIRIDIVDGQTYNIALKVDKGYNPHLFLGDFSKDNISDILVSIESGSTGLEGFFYIYSFLNNQPKKLFDFQEFNNKYRYDVTYADNYTVIVNSKFSNKQFKIDIRNDEFARGLYDTNGKLLRPLKGLVSPITELRPIASDKGYDIQAVQRVVGYFNANTLGFIMTTFRFNGQDFIMISNEFHPVKS